MAPQVSFRFYSNPTANNKYYSENKLILFNKLIANVIEI